jgi:hypothetical protein
MNARLRLRVRLQNSKRKKRRKPTAVRRRSLKSGRSSKLSRRKLRPSASHPLFSKDLAEEKNWILVFSPASSYRTA